MQGRFVLICSNAYGFKDDHEHAEQVKSESPVIYRSEPPGHPKPNTLASTFLIAAAKSSGLGCRVSGLKDPNLLLGQEEVAENPQ